MAKRKAFYVKDENGKWTQINELPDHDIEQLSFAFDVDQETAEKLKDGEEMEFTVSTNPEIIEQVLSDVNSDDVYETLLDEIDKLRNCWLNAMYYVDHAKILSDIAHSDSVLQRELEARCQNIQTLLNDYLEICTREYITERNTIAQAIVKNKLN